MKKDNSGVEGAHKSEELAERGAKYGARKLKQGYRSHKLKPYREAANAEKAAFKANVNFQYHKTLRDNPQLTSNPLSRFMQKQQIKRQYAKAAKKGGAKAAAEATRKTAKKTAEETRKAAAFAARHPAGIFDCSCRAASLYYDFRRAVLLRGYVFGLDKRGAWHVLHVRGQRPCGNGTELRRYGKCPAK